jgi:hypothetical protein
MLQRQGALLRALGDLIRHGAQRRAVSLADVIIMATRERSCPLTDGEKIAIRGWIEDVLTGTLDGR